MNNTVMFFVIFKLLFSLLSKHIIMITDMGLGYKKLLFQDSHITSRVEYTREYTSLYILTYLLCNLGGLLIRTFDSGVGSLVRNLVFVLGCFFPVKQCKLY